MGGPGKGRGQFTIYVLPITISLSVNAILQITEPTGRSWEVELPQGTASIGRSKENDIVLNDRRVSRKHAWISSEGDGFRIVDG